VRRALALLVTGAAFAALATTHASAACQPEQPCGDPGCEALRAQVEQVIELQDLLVNPIHCRQG
jgi:hypothetical protein